MFSQVNIFYEDLPRSVVIDGRAYRIITDFREWIRFTDMVQDNEIPGSVKIEFMRKMFQDQPPRDLNAKSTILAFSDFLACDLPCEETSGAEEESASSRSQARILSYKIDAPYIISGFLQCYGIDLMEIPYLHWWKFRALFNGLNEETEIKKRMYYRSINLSDIKDKEERKRIRKIQQMVSLPQEAISDEDIANAFV